MNKTKFTMILLLVLSIVLSGSDVLANTEGKKSDAEASISIGERLGIDNLNILESGEIKFLDESGNVVENPDIDSKVEVYFDWSLVGLDTTKIKPGDYFEFLIPDTFEVNNTMSGLLGDYGTFIINPDRSVRLIFNENVATESEILGHVLLRVRFNEEILESPGKIEIKLPVKGEQDFEFNIKPKNVSTNVDKSGRAEPALNPKYITWDISINKAYEKLDGAVVVDTLPKGLTAESVEVIPLNLNHDGSFKSLGDPIADSLYDFVGSRVRFKETIEQPFLIRLKTKIEDEVKPDDGGELSFINQVSFRDGEEHKNIAEATVITSYGKLLVKENPSYDAGNQVFTWNVKFNYGEKVIKNPELTDVFHEDLEYIIDSLIIRDINGTEIKNIDYTVHRDASNKIRISFNQEIDQALQISYKTKVKDGKLILDNEIFGNQISIGDKESSSSGTAKHQIITKNSPKIDYKSKEIDWVINLNINKYELNQYQITDTYVYEGLNYKEGTFKLIDASKNNFVVDPINYDFKTTKSSSGIETGFTLSFKNDYETTNSHLRIVYTTHYDVNKLYTVDKNVFRNHAKMDWTDQFNKNHTHSSAWEVKVRDEARFNGSKSGSYNAVSKEITWKVYVNYNAEVLNNSTIKDKITLDQQYVFDSLVVKRYELLPNGNIVVEKDAIDTSSWDIQYPNKDNGEELIIHLPNDNFKYYVEYRTSVSATKVKARYSNTAIFNDGIKDRELKASVGVSNGNKFVTKTGVQDKDVINWSIKINESQSTIKDAKLVDTPSNNQILLEDTFVLYPVKVRENGSFTIDKENPLEQEVDYTLYIFTDETGSQSFELNFLNIIERTYVLEYSSQISASAGDTTIRNSTKLTGDQISYEDVNGSTSIKINVDEAGGGAIGTKGKLSILKVGENGLPLEGVVFELYNKNDVKLSTKATDANGEIEFLGLIYGDYKLKEVSTVGDYIIGDILFNGVNVVVDATSSTESGKLKIENKKNEIVFKKYGNQNQLIDGSAFKLEQLVDGTYIVLEEYLEIIGGEIVLKGYPAGLYRLTEVKAPEGYIVNTEGIDFEIGLDKNGQREDIALEYHNYQGSVRLTKKDSNGKLLSGVLFNLYDGNDSLVNELLETDVHGQINLVNNLAPGAYYFKEVASVEGNIVNESPVHFTIADKANGVPLIIDLMATNFKGSVEFVKKDTNGTLLAGVGFKLIDTDSQEIIANVVSDENGVVRADHLSPGSYAFIETNPNEGYIINDTPIKFIIPETTTEDSVLLELDTFINYKGSVILSKVNEQGESLVGARFDLYNENDEVLQRDLITDKDGHIKILDQLEPGAYYFVETASADENIINEAPIHFTIGSVYTGVPEIVEITATNFKGSVEMIKVDADENALANATFEVYFEDASEPVTSVYSDENGRIRVDHLAPGKYYFVEVAAPKNFMINTERVSFTIPSHTKEDHVLVKIEDDFINYKGSVELSKVDMEDRRLEGVRFSLYNSQDILIYQDLTTDENGIIAINNELSPGDYYFVETSTVDGNIINETPINFTISKEALGVPEVVKVKATNFKGSVEFLKLDVLGNGLSGVEFELYSLENDELIATVLSNNLGYIKVDHLKPGKYKFVESKAQSGFVRNTSEIYFEIPTKTNDDFVLVVLDSFINYQGGITVQKVSESGRLLDGAVFELKDDAGKVISQQTSVGGYVNYKELAPGNYFLTEIKAPKGYELNDRQIKFAVPEEYEGEMEFEIIKFVNIKKTTILPGTGISDNTVLSSLLLIGLGVILIILREKMKMHSIR